MFMGSRDNDFAYINNFVIGLQNYYDSVIFYVFLLDFRTIPRVWYLLFFCQILELFRQCGICCFSVRFYNCSDSVVFVVFLLDFRTVPTVWYLLFFLLDFKTVPTVWYLLFFLLDFRTIPRVWYLLFFCQILELFRLCGICCFSIRFQNCSGSVVFVFFSLKFQNCSKSVVFVICVFLLGFTTVPTVWCLLLFCQILEMF